MNADPCEIRRALDLLCIPDEVYELRALGSGKGTISGYYDNPDALAPTRRFAARSLNRKEFI